MLKEFLSAINRSVSNTAFSNPYGNGINIPPQAAFGKLFNNLLSAFTGNQTNTFNQMQGYNGNGQNQNYNPAAQAYANSLAGGQNFFGATQPKTSNREAFSPGSVISTLEVPPLPQAIPNSYSQTGQLINAINPLQGFAGQAGVAAGAGAIPGAVGAFGAGGGLVQPGQFMPGSYGYSQMGGAGIFGKLSMFIMPLVSLVKSLFGLRGIAGAMQPVQIDNALAYQNSLENYGKQEQTQGSFDESGYWGEDEGESNGFESSNLEM